MTDPAVADVIYLEPLTVEAVEAVIAKERPEGLLAGLGGQTALNLAIALAEAGVFERHADPAARARRSRRSRWPRTARRSATCSTGIGQPYAPSSIVEGATPRTRDASADAALDEIGLPAIVRPAFTLGGTGGGIVETEPAYRERVRAGLRASPIGQVMVERCLVGWQEIEYEVMRDADDTCIAVCSMENVDPLGVHTGDSIVVAPVQTLTDAGPPAAAQRRPRDHPGARRRGRLQRPVRAVARLDRVRGHRGQPARRRARRRWPRRRPATRSPGSRPRSRSAAGWPRSRTS